ncbi:hypothetical protein HMPREF0724_11512 [Prescottella equi ATCC 33707]|uniref:Uncharacterized protein n=1 Tax=Prescottella equi ATCC 33707 TaxID=525370 RepID=E9SZM0_RHOHA|nr:hypothetical protein HMPREF0724_11512 [Prescottella equi ATCC 33707]
MHDLGEGVVESGHGIRQQLECSLADRTPESDGPAPAAVPGRAVPAVLDLAGSTVEPFDEVRTNRLGIVAPTGVVLERVDRGVAADEYNPREIETSGPWFRHLMLFEGNVVLHRNDRRAGTSPTALAFREQCAVRDVGQKIVDRCHSSPSSFRNWKATHHSRQSGPDPACRTDALLARPQRVLDALGDLLRPSDALGP